MGHFLLKFGKKLVILVDLEIPVFMTTTSYWFYPLVYQYDSDIWGFYGIAFLNYKNSKNRKYVLNRNIK